MCICFGREQCGVCAEPFPKEIHEYKQLPTAGVSYRMSEGHGILAETTFSRCQIFPDRQHWWCMKGSDTSRMGVSTEAI